MIILILLIIVLVFMMTISFIYYDTAERFSKNKEMYAVLGFLLPILPVLFSLSILSISNLIVGHFPSIPVSETLLMWSLVGYTLFIFILPQLLSFKWGRSIRLHDSYSNFPSDGAKAAEPREPVYHQSESRRGDMSGF